MRCNRLLLLLVIGVDNSEFSYYVYLFSWGARTCCGMCVNIGGQLFGVGGLWWQACYAGTHRLSPEDTIQLVRLSSTFLPNGHLTGPVVNVFLGGILTMRLYHSSV